MSIARRPELIDSLWNNICVSYGMYYDVLWELIGVVLAAGHPRVRKAQRELRTRAAGALALLKLNTFEANGVRITLVDAPTALVDGMVVITGASRLLVTMNPEEILKASVRDQIAKSALAPKRGTRTVIDIAEARARKLQKAV